MIDPTAMTTEELDIIYTALDRRREYLSDGLENEDEEPEVREWLEKEHQSVLAIMETLKGEWPNRPR